MCICVCMQLCFLKCRVFRILFLKLWQLWNRRNIIVQSHFVDFVCWSFRTHALSDLTDLTYLRKL